MLDRGSALEAAEPGDPDAPRATDTTEIVAQDVNDHHVLGAVLGTAQQLAREGPVLGPVASTRSGAFDRVGADRALGVHGQERFGRRGEDGARFSRELPGPEIEKGREQRWIAGPEAPVQRPWILVEGGLEPACQVRLVDVPARNVIADALDTGLERGSIEAAVEREACANGVRCRGYGSGGPVGGHRQPGVDVVEPSRQASPVAIECPAAKPGVAGSTIPGNHPVMQGQAERRQVLVGHGDRRHPLEQRAQVVPEETDESAEERRCVGRHDRCAIEARDEAPRDRKRIRSGRRRLENGHWIRRQVRPPGITPRPCAFEQDKTRQVAERLGGVDGAASRDSVRQPPESKWSAGTRRGDHRRDDTAGYDRAMQVRPASPADIPTMAAILDASNESIGWPDVPGWPYLEYLVDRAATAVAIGRDGSVVGFGGAIEAGPVDGRAARWLTDLFVHPERREAGAGRAILDHLLDGATDRMTASTGDRRALSLYIRAGMRPWWPFLYLSGDVDGLPGDGAIIESAGLETTATWSRTWTGRDQTADFEHYASLPDATGFAIRDAGSVAAVGWARRDRQSVGRWLDHVSIAPDADPVRAVFAAWRAAAPDGGRVRGVVPGPHPAVGPLLDRGIRILDRDTFCATDPGLLDPVRILPNPGFL
jgi:GNAT superfamily N-acetyltransferase